MTRDNEIANAASEAMTETLMSCPMYEFSPKATDLLECAYIKGAEWADAHPVNPWHSIADGDLPKEEKLYLCGDNSDYIIGEWNAETRRFTDPFSKFDNQRIDWVKYWMEIPKLPSE